MPARKVIIIFFFVFFTQKAAAEITFEKILENPTDSRIKFRIRKATR